MCVWTYLYIYGMFFIEDSQLGNCHLQIQKTKESFVSINRLSLLKTCCTCVTCSGNFQLTQTKKALYMCHMKTRGLYCRAHIWNVKLNEMSSFPNDLNTVLTLQLQLLSLYVSNEKWWRVIFYHATQNWNNLPVYCKQAPQDTNVI